ncbi:MAG: hypothetical protein U0412_04455 [Nitrospira sp.]
MIKVELICGFTELTFPAISFPDCEFDGGGDDTPSFCIEMNRLCKVFVALDGDGWEFVNDPMFILFLPGIDKMKDAVIRPNT